MDACNPELDERTEAAAAVLALALARLLDELEGKAGFDPNQPRVPAGFPTGGQWTFVGAAPTWLPTWTDLERGAGAASNRVRGFLERNQKSVTRVLGGIQAIGGGAEMVGGVGLVAAGVPTSEVGVGVVLAGVGSWMVFNGYDNFDAGWRALMTGEAQGSLLHTTLRKMGASESEALAVEVALSGGTVGAAKLSSRGLDAAAKAGLARRAIRPFTSQPLIVRSGNRSLWDEPDIVRRGLAWEAFDAERTGFRRLAPNFRTFDQASLDGSIAVSNKTLDLVTFRYSRDKSQALYTTLRRYIDQVAGYKIPPGPSPIGRAGVISERRLHLLMPSGEALPAQELQIAAAEVYARERGVVLRIEYAR